MHPLALTHNNTTKHIRPPKRTRRRLVPYRLGVLSLIRRSVSCKYEQEFLSYKRYFSRTTRAGASRVFSSLPERDSSLQLDPFASPFPLRHIIFPSSPWWSAWQYCPSVTGCASGRLGGGGGGVVRDCGGGAAQTGGNDGAAIDPAAGDVADAAGGASVWRGRLCRKTGSFAYDGTKMLDCRS